MRLEELVKSGVIVSDSILRENVTTEIEDDILLQASQVFEDQAVIETNEPSRRFGNPVRSNEIEVIKEGGVPEKTKLNTAWSLKVWSLWAESRKSAGYQEECEKDHPLDQDFVHMDVDSMAFWLPRFVVEIRKENTEMYPPNSIYNLCCGLQRELRFKEKHINIFADNGPFTKFRQVLDSRMKKLNASGKFQRKQADVITEEIEDKLWEVKVLGDGTPQSLLDSLLLHRIVLRSSWWGGASSSQISPVADIST